LAFAVSTELLNKPFNIINTRLNFGRVYKERRYYKNRRCKDFGEQSSRYNHRIK
jgi:hypothetical protein